MNRALALTLIAVVLFVACEKNDIRVVAIKQYPNNIIELPDDEKKRESTFQMSINVGHSSSSCNGCIMYNGQLCHVNCMGDGVECAPSATVQLQQISFYYTAVTTDTFGLTDQNFFNMPDRSLYAGKDEKGNDLWLNIPAQLVYRDSSSLQFTFTGLFYSNTQYYSNR